MDEQYWYNMTTIVGKQQLNRNFSCGAKQSSLTVRQNNCLDIPKTVHETFKALLFLNTYNNKMYTSSLLWKHSHTWTTLQPNLHKASQPRCLSKLFIQNHQPTNSSRVFHLPNLALSHVTIANCGKNAVGFTQCSSKPQDQNYSLPIKNMKVINNTWHGKFSKKHNGIFTLALWQVTTASAKATAPSSISSNNNKLQNIWTASLAGLLFEYIMNSVWNHSHGKPKTLTVVKHPIYNSKFSAKHNRALSVVIKIVTDHR